MKNLHHENIFIIGPGGVGNTTCGRIVARKIGYAFIDLDAQFMEKIGHIGELIRKEGYDRYCQLNSSLLYELLEQNPEKTIFVLSSGFLTYEIDNLKEKHLATIESAGISVLLLPSVDLEKSVEIVIARQLSRGFGLVREKEEKKFRERFDMYKNLGDIKIFSADAPDLIAEKIIPQIS